MGGNDCDGGGGYGSSSDGSSGMERGKYIILENMIKPTCY